ncbi:concanavalin A-like lectin/glucanase domain-containing protein [Aspergillus karnatakaensis]|uniref:glycoside hydrolase family 7 protein n=1 Tax=Aspergillus karnatakaensis TaxID=1810916 RepID=UPI003CCDD254
MPLPLKPLALSLAVALSVTLPHLSTAQQIGSPENRPSLSTYHCTTAHGCTRQNTTVVLDAATHPIHNPTTNQSCTTPSNTLNPVLCPDKQTCASNCVIEGISNYAAYGVTTQGSKLTLQQYLNENGTLNAVSPRVYLVSESENYETLHLLNQEFTFDVDVSQLPCGMNGALYLSEMHADGGRSPLNPAGSAYGTGYCDAQCYVTPWINGEANTENHGSCCNEMDIWEANSRATGLTPHACLYDGGGLHECTSDEECNGPTGENDSVCDKWGCSFNPYALGRKDYYGLELTVDTTKPFTVVTQFITDDGTAMGTLNEIRRLYIQNNRLIKNAVISIPPSSNSSETTNALSDAVCDATTNWFGRFGGMDGMGQALGRGMVLAMSIWNDAGGYMQWLDGGDAGPCNATEGAPAVIEQTTPGTRVVFGGIRWGDLGSTFGVKRGRE